MRRKGERPIEKVWPAWGPGHPVAQNIATGGHWLDAWIQQSAIRLDKLCRLSGVPMSRIGAIARGDRLTRAELNGLAAAWKVDPAQVEASLVDPLLLVG